MSNFDTKDQVTVQATTAEATEVISQSSLPKDPSVAVIKNPTAEDASSVEPADQIENEKQGFWAFFKTKEFYIILALG